MAPSASSRPTERTDIVEPGTRILGTESSRKQHQSPGYKIQSSIIDQTLFLENVAFPPECREQVYYGGSSHCSVVFPSHRSSSALSDRDQGPRTPGPAWLTHLRGSRTWGPGWGTLQGSAMDLDVGARNEITDGSTKPRGLHVTVDDGVVILAELVRDRSPESDGNTPR